MQREERAVFRGMMPIMPTAIDEEGNIDEGSQRRLVRYCLEYGAVAIGHFGSASEFFKISDRDRARLAEIIVDEVGGRVPVFMGVTGASDRIAAGYAKEAEDRGADLIMASLPYVRLPLREEVHDYFRRLTETTGLPIIIQDTPMTAAILNVETILELADSFASVVSVKAEGASFLAKSEELSRRAAGRLQVIGGAGGKHLIHLLRLGVTAFMTGTEALDLHGAAVRAFLAGDEERAARIYFERILPYFVFYNDHPDLLLKEMLHMRGVIENDAVIPPVGSAPLAEVERRELAWILERVQWGGPPVSEHENLSGK